MDAAPFPFVWTGEAMVPPPGFAKRADQTFVIGERYVLAEVLERSAASHRHFFALVREAWMNLPEADALRFPNETALRKHCLIKAGFCDIQTTVCQFRTEARRLAAVLARSPDDYTIVTVNGKVVTEYRAKSQDSRSMDKATFQDSKDKVLAILADMIGVEVATLQRQERAA